MAGVLSTLADLNAFFNLIYEDVMFVARETNLMTGLVTNYSATGWMARKLTTYPSLVAEPINEAVDYSAAQLWDKQLVTTFTPSEIIAQVVLTDRRMETDPDDARRDASTEMGNAVAKKIDKDIIGDFASFSTDKGTGAGSAASISSFAASIAVLRNNLVPNPVYIVAHPYHWHDVWTQLGQPGANQALLGDLANQALRDYFVGRWINVLWFTSANIAIDGSGDAVSAVFNPGALAFDSRKPPSMEPERDASLRAWELNITAGYAHGIRRSTFGVKYTADATEPV